MSARDQVRGAAGAVGLAWLVHAALAALPAWQLADGVWSVVGHRPEGAGVLWAPGGGAAIEAGWRWLREARGALPWTFGAATLGALILSPWLTMTLLAALQGGRSLRQAAISGMRTYLPAVVVTAVVGLAGATFFALLGLLPVAAHLLLRAHPNAALHDLAVLGASAPALVALAPWGAWHDQSRAALLEPATGPRRAVARGLRRLGPRRVAVFVGYGVLGAALAAAAARLAAADLSGAVALLVVTVLGQLAVVARLLVRARWLATCVTPESESPGPPATGSTPPTR
ncbi:MAG: hypothetical protein ACOC97_03280 [Myxococcota bacterium]